MAYGTKPAGKAKPSMFPFGPSGGTEMTSKDKGKKSFKGMSKEINKGPVKGGKR